MTKRSAARMRYLFELLSQQAEMQYFSFLT